MQLNSQLPGYELLTKCSRFRKFPYAAISVVVTRHVFTPPFHRMKVTLPHDVTSNGVSRTRIRRSGYRAYHIPIQDNTIIELGGKKRRRGMGTPLLGYVCLPP